MSARLLYATCKAHQKSLLESRARYTVGAGWSIEPAYELAFTGAPTSGPHRNYVKIRLTDGKFVVYSDGKKIHTKIEIAPLRAFVNRALQELQDVDLGVNDDDSRRPWEIIRDLESSWVQLFADRTASKLPDGYKYEEGTELRATGRGCELESTATATTLINNKIEISTSALNMMLTRYEEEQPPDQEGSSE